MYPQQPQQPQGTPPVPPQPQQPGPSQPYPIQPGQAPQGYVPAQPADPWQLQQPTPSQLYAQPTPQPQQSWPQQTPGSTYTEPAAPLTPDGIASIDYLNQIAPKQPTPFGFSRKQVAIIGGVILLGFLGFAVATLLQGNKPNIAGMSQQLTTRVGATTFIARESQQHLRSREIDSVNSSLTLQLANTGTGLTDAFAKVGIGIGDAKNAAADDTSEETTAKLEEARLNGIFDRVYAREMSYRLTTILLQIDAIHQITENADLKAYLEETYANLDPLRKQLEEYSATTS